MPLPGARLTARCQMASVPSYSPETPASRCATRESRRGAGECDSPPATHQTQSDTGTGRYRVESAMCKEFANNQEFEICGAWRLLGGEAEGLWWGGGQGSWAELMLHQKAFTAVCYLIDVHSSQGQAQDNCRAILLLILKEQKSLESKVNLQRPCSCSGTYCRRGSRTAHQANAISSFSFYCVCKVHLALLTSVISTPKILSCWATQTFHQQTP